MERHGSIGGWPACGEPVSPLRKAALLATPPALIASMLAAFRWLPARLGKRRGYFAGFLIYWLGWCLLVPLALVGPQRLRARQRPGKVTTGETALLALPPALGFTAAFPQAIRGADPAIVAGSAALATVNGALEELLWRDAYQAAFPDRPALAVVYPTAGFALWHYAPQLVFPNPRPGGATSLVAVAGVAGAIWSTVAYRSGSSRAGTISHILFDFSGLGARLYLKRETVGC